MSEAEDEVEAEKRRGRKEFGAASRASRGASHPPCPLGSGPGGRHRCRFCRVGADPAILACTDRGDATRTWRSVANAAIHQPARVPLHAVPDLDGLRVRAGLSGHRPPNVAFRGAGALPDRKVGLPSVSHCLPDHVPAGRHICAIHRHAIGDELLSRICRCFVDLRQSPSFPARSRTSPTRLRSCPRPRRA